MGVLKNAATTLVVTGLLIAGLVVLFPSAQAGTPSATLDTAGVSAIDANGDVLLTIDFVLPEGTPFDASQLRVYVTGAEGACASPLTVANGGLVIVSVVQRVEEDASLGYGYGYVNAYGYTENLLGFTVRVRTDNCAFFVGAGTMDKSFGFRATHGGVDTGVTNKTLVNIAWVLANKDPNAADAGTAPLTTNTPTTKIISITNAGNDYTDPSTIGPITVGGFGSNPSTEATITLDPNGPPLPPGTEIVIEEADGEAGSLEGPSFGIAPAQLGGRTNSDPIRFYRVTVNVPGQGQLADAGTVIQSVTLTACATGAELTTAGLVDTVRMRLLAFNEQGTQKGSTQQPLIIASTLTVNGASPGTTNVKVNTLAPGDNVCYDYQVNHFSSFALIASIPAAGGGGGGGGGTVGDSDADGLPDDWEQQYFGGTGADPSGDDDNDGLTNLEEFQQGTDPTSADSDLDGISDKDEIDAGTDPNDSSDPGAGTAGDQDGDGLSDAFERAVCGDATSCDPDGDEDGDGLTNKQEFDLGTDATDPDSDGDGVNDGDEVSRGTDPNRADQDTGEDGQDGEDGEDGEDGDRTKTPGFEAIAVIAALAAVGALVYRRRD